MEVFRAQFINCDCSFMLLALGNIWRRGKYFSEGKQIQWENNHFAVWLLNNKAPVSQCCGIVSMKMVGYVKI